MANVLRVQIGNSVDVYTDYGPAPWGNGTLQKIALSMAGSGAVGAGQLDFVKSGGGLVFKSRQFVRIFEDSGVYPSSTVARWWLQGFVADKTTEELVTGGTAPVQYHVKIQDVNILLDWLRLFANASPIVTDGGDYHFDHQITRIFAVATFNNTGVSPTIDTSSGVALAGIMSGPLKGFGYQGIHTREAVQRRCDAYQADFPATRPLFNVSPPTTGVSATDPPQLNIWDDALTASASPVYTFAHNPTGSQRSIMKYTRRVDGIDLATRVEAINTARSGGGIYKSTYNSTNQAVYPNDFDQRPLGIAGAPLLAWDAPLIKTQGGVPDAVVTATATQAGEAKENPSETITIVSADYDPVGGPTVPLKIKPGDVITVIWPSESINQKYRVNKVDVVWQPRQGAWWPIHTITAGNQELGLGDDNQQVNARVQELDNMHPPPPTSPSMTSSWWSEKTRDAITTFGWTAPSPFPPNIVEYRLYLTVGRRRIPVIRAVSPAPGGTPPTSVTVHLPAFSAGAGYICSVSGGNVESDYVAIPPFNTARIPDGNDRTPPNQAYSATDPEDTTGTLPESWTFDAESTSGTGARDTTHLLDGANTLSITANGSGNKGQWISSPARCFNPVTALMTAKFGLFISFSRQSLNFSTGTFNLYIDWLTDLITPTVSYTDTLLTGTPSTTPVSADTQAAPTFGVGIIGYRLRLEYIGGAAGTNTLVFSPFRIAEQVIANGVKDGTITSAKLASAAVTAGKIAVGGISAANQFAAGVVDNAALGLAAVTAAKIGTGEVTAGKIAAGGVSAANQIANGIVGDAQLGTLTDPTKPHYDIQTNPLKWYDAGANDKGQVAYDNANDELVHSAANATSSNTSLRLKTSARSIKIDDSASTPGIKLSPNSSPVTMVSGVFEHKVHSTITSNQTADASAGVWPIDTTSGTVTLTLPAASGCGGREYLIKRINAGVNLATIARTGSDTFEGATSLSLGAQWKSYTLVSDGSATWWIKCST